MANNPTVALALEGPKTLDDVRAFVALLETLDVPDYAATEVKFGDMVIRVGLADIDRRP